MSYVVLARKWRPKYFEEVVGQEHVARTLKNSIRQDRVAHAYLFTGTRGVGKTSTARILAKALNCHEGPTETPCYECSSCKEISQGQSVDVFEIDGASNRGSTRSGSCARGCATRRVETASRSTSSTRCTCSPTRRSTPCSRRSRSRRRT